MSLLASTSHVEAVMGTMVGFSSPTQVSATTLAAAVAELREADRVFSTWNPTSPLSLLRAGRVVLRDLAPHDAGMIAEVLARCELAREITGGAFDPWAMPGGVDPSGLVKGWATDRALSELLRGGVEIVMVNAGGDVAVAGRPDDRPWRVGVRHPAQPDAVSAVVEITHALATSGDYERPGELLNPRTGRVSREAASASVIGPSLDLVDALATGLAVAGRSLLREIDRLPGYEGYLITHDGRHFATSCMPFAAA